MSAEGLQWLRDNVDHFEEIVGAESRSTLLAMSDKTHVQSLEKYQEQPNEIEQRTELLSSGSFIDYVNRFKNAASSIYLNVDGGVFMAVIDHHELDEPAWCKHSAVFEAKASLEWNAWSAICGTVMNQRGLAHFIEENLDDIVEPEPADMLKAALEFESVENMTFVSTQNLDDGSLKFNFTKENANKSVEFPHRIAVRIPVIENETPWRLEARVRYKTDSDGVLTFKITFVRDLSKIRRDALRSLAAGIQAGTDGLPSYEGRLQERGDYGRTR